MSFLNIVLLSSNYMEYFEDSEKDLGKANMVTKINNLGSAGYFSALTISIWICALSLLLLFVSRFIFRIAWPKEDAQTKMTIQRILLIVFILSFLSTVFSAVINFSEGLHF